MGNIKQICVELANLAKRKHYFCEDSWYSCPKAEGGCANDAEGDECTCGADAHNAKVNELLAAALVEPEGPTLDEIDDLCAEHSFCYKDSESLECLLLIITDALARWGNHPGSPDSLPQPVPVTERLPKIVVRREGCW